MAIGACDSPEDNWQRAPYSSIGPGRSPGIVKPDLVDFGGSLQRPFLTLGLGNTPSIEATGFASFATPCALRTASGILAHFDTNIGSLATRALLVHNAQIKRFWQIMFDRKGKFGAAILLAHGSAKSLSISRSRTRRLIASQQRANCRCSKWGEAGASDRRTLISG